MWVHGVWGFTANEPGDPISGYTIKLWGATPAEGTGHVKRKDPKFWHVISKPFDVFGLVGNIAKRAFDIC